MSTPSFCTCTVAVSELTCFTFADGRLIAFEPGAASPRLQHRDENQIQRGSYFQSALLRPVVCIPHRNTISLPSGGALRTFGLNRSHFSLRCHAQLAGTEFRLRVRLWCCLPNLSPGRSPLGSCCLLPSRATAHPRLPFVFHLFLAARRNFRLNGTRLTIEAARRLDLV